MPTSQKGMWIRWVKSERGNALIGYSVRLARYCAHARAEALWCIATAADQRADIMTRRSRRPRSLLRSLFGFRLRALLHPGLA